MSDGVNALPTKHRLLVVEDENIVAMDICQGLERLGHEVVGVANNGSQALDIAERLRPDLILMDIQIKGDKDGIETSKEIWTRLHIPVIFLTAYADKKTLERAKSAEPFGYILKPFEERELHTTIEVVLGKHRRVTEEHQSQQEALRQSEERFHLLVDAVKDYAIVMLDPVGRVISWNKGAERVYGYQQNEIIGQHFSIAYTREDIDLGKFEDELKTALEHGRCENLGWRVKKHGEQFWVSAITYPLWENGTRLRGFARITRDISEWKKAEDERNLLLKKLQETLRIGEEFISIASHELRTPVTSLGLQFDFMERIIAREGIQAITLEKVKKFIRVSRQQGERLSRLVNDLLDLTRITSGTLPIERNRVHLEGMVSEVVDRFSELHLDSLCLPIEVHVDHEIWGFWDRFRLEQVISNLLSNAVKYGTGGVIQISGTLKHETVILSIRDHGIGIEKAAQERIFDCFERAVSSTNISGFGLGLYIAKTIVIAHGGSIRVESEPGKGSLFIIELPLGSSSLEGSSEGRPA